MYHVFYFRENMILTIAYEITSVGASLLKLVTNCCTSLNLLLLVVVTHTHNNFRAKCVIPICRKRPI